MKASDPGASEFAIAAAYCALLARRTGIEPVIDR
jgi:hypothetical protein